MCETAHTLFDRARVEPWPLLGRGFSREVYEVPENPEIVLKIARCLSEYPCDNEIEWRLWHDQPGIRHLVARPLSFYRDTETKRSALVMERVDPAADTRGSRSISEIYARSDVAALIDALRKNRITDVHVGNIGVSRKTSALVCVDYAF